MDRKNKKPEEDYKEVLKNIYEENFDFEVIYYLKYGDKCFIEVKDDHKFLWLKINEKKKKAVEMMFIGKGKTRNGKYRLLKIMDVQYRIDICKDKAFVLPDNVFYQVMKPDEVPKIILKMLSKILS